MDNLRTSLKPLTDWMPEGMRDLLPSVELWWLIFLAVGLIGLFILYRMLRRLFRSPARKSKGDWDRSLRINLAECPLPVKPPREHELAVYHVPVRVRLLVVAPSGKEVKVDAGYVVPLLDRIMPGLGAIIRHDKPLVRIWPPQLSHQGFINTFHRCTPIPRPAGSPAPDDEEPPSRWIMVAGTAHVGHAPYLIGLGLWAEETNTIGRVNVEPHHWLDVLRIQKVDE